MPLQSSGQLTARDIANEFGYSRGSTDGIRIGDYRGQGFTNPNNTTVRIPTSENVTNDPNGSVRFSDFYGGRLTIVVNYFGAAAEIKPGDAYGRFSFTDNNGNHTLRAVVGNDTFGQFKPFSSNNSAGKRVVILVNEDIGSDKVANTSCALRTGTGWNSDTVMRILVGPDGEILGAGGDGGNGVNAGNGFPGGAGSSGLGVQFEGVGGTSVVIQSGGKISGGAGGGGAGGGAWVRQERFFGEGPIRRATGGEGGGGAGFPAGNRADRVNGGAGVDGTHQGSNPGAEGGFGGNGGGISGTIVNSGSRGVDGTTSGSRQEDPARYSGGGGGAAGAAIRRTVPTVIITNEGPPSQLAGSTVETGVT